MKKWILPLLALCLYTSPSPACDPCAAPQYQLAATAYLWNDTADCWGSPPTHTIPIDCTLTLSEYTPCLWIGTDEFYTCSLQEVNGVWTAGFGELSAAVPATGATNSSPTGTFQSTGCQGEVGLQVGDWENISVSLAASPLLAAIATAETCLSIIGPTNAIALCNEPSLAVTYRLSNTNAPINSIQWGVDSTALVLDGSTTEPTVQVRAAGLNNNNPVRLSALVDGILVQLAIQILTPYDLVLLQSTPTPSPGYVIETMLFEVLDQFGNRLHTTEGPHTLANLKASVRTTKCSKNAPTTTDYSNIPVSADGTFSVTYQSLLTYGNRTELKDCFIHQKPFPKPPKLPKPQFGCGFHQCLTIRTDPPSITNQPTTGKTACCNQ